MILRLLKIKLTAMVAVFFTLVVVGNTFDYGTNFAFVQHVLSMDTTFRSPTVMGRAITDPTVHHLAYAAIIAWEAFAGILCWIGTARLLAALRAPGPAFDRAKAAAFVGLGAGFLLYGLGFMVVAAEWFQMWQSSQWNGQAAAARFMILIGIPLILLALPDRDPD